MDVVDSLILEWSATEEITNKCHNMCHASVIKSECYSLRQMVVCCAAKKASVPKCECYHRKKTQFSMHTYVIVPRHTI